MKLIIFGIGRLSKIMHYYFTHDAKADVVAFTVTKEYIQNESFMGLPVIPFEEIENRYAPQEYRMFIAVGYKSLRNRRTVYEIVKAKDYLLTNFISVNSITYPDLKIGENNAFFPNVTVEPFVEIGNNNIFCSNSLVSHDVIIGDHNYISADVTVGGGSTVENLCFMGNGSILINDIHLANETQVLPGSVIYESTKAYNKYIGTPARAFGNHEETGIIVERG